MSDGYEVTFDLDGEATTRRAPTDEVLLETLRSGSA